MKLAFGGSGLFIEFRENRIEQLIIEHPGCFREIVEEMIRQCKGEEGKMTLSDKDKVIDFSGNVLVISDPLNLQRNTKKILSRMYEQMRISIFERSLHQRFYESAAAIEAFAYELDAVSEYAIQYDTNITVQGLLKFLNVKLAEEDQTYPETLSDYLKLVSDLLNIRLIVFVHLKSYLGKEELIQLYQMANYRKIFLLLLESREYEMLEYEHRYIIDSDMCII